MSGVRLATEERAALVAVLLAGGGAVALARLGGAAALRTVELEKELAALGREERAAWLAAEAAALAAPVPANLALVHPSWREGAEAAPGAEPSVAVWLARVAYGALVGMPEGLPEPAVLEARVESLGRARLALALRAVPAAAQAQVAARLGEVHGAALLTELRAAAPRTDVSAAVRELQDLVAGSAPLLLLRAGARHVAPAVAARGDLGRQLAQRLPRPAGIVWLDELARGAGGAGAGAGAAASAAEDALAALLA